MSKVSATFVMCSLKQIKEGLTGHVSAMYRFKLCLFGIFWVFRYVQMDLNGVVLIKVYVCMS